jgi:signal transduction histidine kinase
VDNAIRHTPAGGQVDLTASRQNGTVLLVVDDTGPGFTAAPVSNLFEPFAPAGRKAEKEEGSGGLGLAVVRTSPRLTAAGSGRRTVRRAAPG